MKQVTILAVFQFTRGKNRHPGQGQRASRRVPFRPVLPGSRPRPIFFARLGIIRGHDRIVERQAPLAAVFYRGGLMINSEMPFQHRKPLAALETDQLICLYGLPDRDGRLAMRRRNRLPGLYQCLMDIVDKFREVRRGYGVVADMGADDLDCQRAHCFFGHIPVLRKHKTRHQQWLESVSGWMVPALEYGSRLAAAFQRCLNWSRVRRVMPS